MNIIIYTKPKAKLFMNDSMQTDRVGRKTQDFFSC